MCGGGMKVKQELWREEEVRKEGGASRINGMHMYAIKTEGELSAGRRGASKRQGGRSGREPCKGWAETKYKEIQIMKM